MTLNTIEAKIKEAAKDRLTEKVRDFAGPIVNAVQENTYNITIKDINNNNVTVSNLSAITAIVKAEIIRRLPNAETKAINDFINKVAKMGGYDD